MGLYEKMYNIMCDTESLKKDLSVGGQYKAVSEKEVLNSIKPLLKKYKVILFPISANVSLNGKITQVEATYKIVDIESGESEVLATVGNGADSQDKGSGKAMTYAYKVMLQKSFMMFSGEDTDNTHSDDITSNIKKSDSKVTVQMLQDVISKLGKTDAEYIEWYNGKVDTKAISELKYMAQDTKQHLYGVLIKKVGK